MKRFIRLILLVLTLSCSAVLSVFAVDSNGNSGGGTSNAGSGSGTGNSDSHTGYLIYMLDQDGNLISEVVFAYVTNSPESASGNNQTYLLSSRIGGQTFSRTRAGVPWDRKVYVGKSGVGQGKAIKDWLVSEYESGKYNVSKSINLIFGEELENKFTFAEESKSIYFVVESVHWHRLFHGMNSTGQYVVGTTNTLAQLNQQIGNPCVRDGYPSWRYDNNFLPYSAYLEFNWLGQSVPSNLTSEVIPYANQINEGYGMLMVRNTGLATGDKTHTWDYTQSSTPAPAPSPPKQGLTREIVKVYRTRDVNTGEITWDGAFYRPYTSSKITVEDEPEYKVIEWETSRIKTASTLPTAKWDDVRSNSTKTKNGTTTGLVELTDETTLYVLLEREKGKDPNPNPPSEGSHGEEEADIIKAWELNYIFPNFSGSRTGSKAGFDLKSFHFSDFWQYSGKNSWTHDNQVAINETANGDITNFNGAKSYLYNTSNPLWKIFTEGKTFGVSELLTPQYAYISSRGMWEDSLVLSNYRNSLELGTPYEVYRTWISDYLKMNEGNKGNITSASAGVGVEGVLSAMKSDAYTYSGQAQENYQYHYYCSDEDCSGHWAWENPAPTPMTSLEYIVNHLCEKYKAPTSTVVGNPKAGETAYSSTGMLANENVYMKQAFSSQSTSQMNVYPEVEMKFWYNNKADSTYSPVEQKIYVMAERERSANPAILHGYSAGYNGSGNKPKGITTLPSASTGTNANKAADAFGDHSINGVTAMGTTFETASTNNPVVILHTVALDVQDSIEGSAVRSDWGNAGYNPRASHDAYVESMKNSIGLEVSMRNFDKSGSVISDWYNMQINTSNTKVVDVGTETLNIKYKAGQVTNKAEIISKLASLYTISTAEATTMYNNWGIDLQLDQMFTSSTDYGNKSSDKWYDEESIAMCLRIYTSNMVFGKVSFDDKVDYNLLGQSANRMQNGTQAIEARFFMKIKFMNSTISVDGQTFSTYNANLRFDEMEGARFLIANLTTTAGKK